MKYNHLQLIYYTFIAGLFAMPFVYWPKAEVAYEIPRVWFVARWIEVLAVATIIKLPSKSVNKTDPKILFLTGFFFTIAIATSLIGSDLGKSIVGNYYRGDGLITLAHLISLFFFTALFFKKTWIDLFVKAVVYSAGGVSLLAISQYVALHLTNLPVVNWQGAVGATFGQPNFLSGYLLIVLPFTFYLILKTKKTLQKYAVIFVIFLQITAIIFTYSRAGLAGIFIFTAIAVFFIRKNIPRFIIPAAILLMIPAAMITINTIVSTPGIEGHVSAESRERILTKGYLAAIQRPLTGWGWANFDHAFESIVYPVEFKSDVYVDKAHSTLLEILVTTGVLGLFIYLAIIVRGALMLIRSKTLFSKILLFSLILFLLHSQTNVISIAEEMLFWIILGISAGYKK